MNYSKSSKPHSERRAIAEDFCGSNTLLHLIKLDKLIQIYILISVWMRPIQKYNVCDKSDILMRIRNF